MSLKITDADPTADYDALADLLNQETTEPTSAAQLREWDAADTPGTIRRRAIAKLDGRIVGYYAALRRHWRPPGVFFSLLQVDRAWRDQGIGAQLFQDLLAFIGAHDGHTLLTEIKDTDIKARHWAERRGFRMESHVFESVLDLTTFDAARFADVVTGVEAQGLRLLSLAEVGNTEEWQRRLYEVNYRGALADPASTGGADTWITFEEMQHIWAAGAWFRPELQVMAVTAADEVVGMSAMGVNNETTGDQLMTAVDAAYQGRKIAQALKVEITMRAQVLGLTHIRTGNDSSNRPMLAVNRKLGFLPEPGAYVMERR